MGKATGWILFTVGLFFMALFPLAFLTPIPGVSRLVFTNPQALNILMIIGIVIMFSGIFVLAFSQDKFPEKRMEIIDRQFPCPVCKKDVFTWGKVPSSRVRVRVGAGQPTWARVCQNCGNVQQFTKTD